MSGIQQQQREYDLVIFGATGYTGYFMVRELVLSLQEKPEEYSTLKWAVAGRNVGKLEDTLTRLAKELKTDLSTIVKIEADVNDATSLGAMARRTRLLVNVVGPFELWGKQVVDACVTAGTHHLDISGEPTYIESSQIAYDARARDSGSLIISTVGWDSIPNDIGVAYLKERFAGQLHSVESFMKVHPGPHGYKANIGTFQSAVNFLGDYLAYLKIHSQLYKEVLKVKLPKSNQKLRMRLLPFYQNGGWNAPFLGADKAVVERSQAGNYELYGEKPVQFQPYITVGSLWALLMAAFGGFFFLLLCFFKAGRNLLTNYPEVLTFGFFSKVGPSRQQVDTTRFSLTLQGKGWKTGHPNGEPNRPFDKQMTLVINGRDPGYVATSTCTIQAALTVLKEREKMPKGGVLTPATAFRGTNLVERLQERDLKFEIVAN